MITQLAGRWRPLSNFWHPCTVKHDGLTFTSSEAAFQAAKTQNLEIRLLFTTYVPSLAKRAGRGIALRRDWNDVRIDVMREILRSKFTQNEPLRQILMLTGDQQIIEGNTWNDTFWGVCRGKGENHLGKLLMQVREELR